MSYFNYIEETKHEIFHILKSPPSSCHTNNNAAAASLNHSSCPMLASLPCRASLYSPRSPVRCMDPEGRASADTDTSTLPSDTLSLLYKLNSAYIAFKYNSNYHTATDSCFSYFGMKSSLPWQVSYVIIVLAGSLLHFVATWIASDNSFFLNPLMKYFMMLWTVYLILLLYTAVFLS